MRLLDHVETTFIKHFTNGNRTKGMNILQPKAKRERHRLTFSTGTIIISRTGSNIYKATNNLIRVLVYGAVQIIIHLHLEQKFFFVFNFLLGAHENLCFRFLGWMHVFPRCGSCRYRSHPKHLTR